MTEGSCRECGDPCFVGDDGVSHHGTPDEIDHDADAVHVAILEEEPVDGKHSILYTTNFGGRLSQLGPFDSWEEALAAAKKAQMDATFDITDQYVYHLNTDHTLYEISMAELGVE